MIDKLQTFLLFAILFSGWNSTSAQTKTFKISIKNLPYNQVVFVKIQGDKFETRDMVFISLDTSSQKWKEKVFELGIGWYNLSDLKSLDGPVAEDYNVYATPTFFVIDRQRKILKKP